MDKSTQGNFKRATGTQGADIPRAGTIVGLHTNPDATSHELLNEATQWLHYARGTTGLLIELISEIDMEELRRYPKLVIALEGISAMTNMGVLCAAEAHARMGWERAVAQRDLAVAQADLVAEQSVFTDGQPSP